MDESRPIYGLYRFKRGFNGRLDELAGEFDFVYRPICARLTDAALDAKAALARMKKRCSR